VVLRSVSPQVGVLTFREQTNLGVSPFCRETLSAFSCAASVNELIVSFHVPSPIFFKCVMKIYPMRNSCIFAF
ncbi:hypothetical protein AAHB54_23420, partial [Bacillus cereus]